ELRLVPPVAGVPAEEADAALGHELGEIVLGEVDLVVRGDHRHARPHALGRVVQALARHATRTRTPRAGGFTADEGLADHRGRPPRGSAGREPPASCDARTIVKS